MTKFFKVKHSASTPDRGNACIDVGCHQVDIYAALDYLLVVPSLGMGATTSAAQIEST
jgi:hypothetical protein